MALKTDYKDDIPKTENRRYQMIHNDDGTVSFVDVTEYTQVGDTFGAGDINATNESVNGKVESTDIVDPALVTKEGFAADALAVKKQFDEQNKNIGIFQKTPHFDAFMQPSTWTKIENFTINLTTGVYILNFWIRSQGGGSLSSDHLTPFMINIALSEENTYNQDPFSGCLNKNWGITNCSMFLNVYSTKNYNLFIIHDAKEAHLIDFEILIIKIR